MFGSLPKYFNPVVDTVSSYSKEVLKTISKRNKWVKTNVNTTEKGIVTAKTKNFENSKTKTDKKTFKVNTSKSQVKESNDKPNGKNNVAFNDTKEISKLISDNLYGIKIKEKEKASPPVPKNSNCEELEDKFYDYKLFQEWENSQRRKIENRT
jgi:predicted ribonuclease toxin of YeeF-YezG toxin-antitoxin module